MNSGLSASGLTCLRGEKTVLRNLSFSVPPGQALMVRGANGAGKSTLLRVLAGLLRAQTGEVLLDGAPLAEDRSRLCWLGHGDALKPAESVEEALRFRAALYGAGTIEPALEALALAPLRQRPARELSAGQKRRVALAGVIASGAPLWLLDEPGTALDAASAALFQLALDRHLAAGGMAVIATHDAYTPAASSELRL